MMFAFLILILIVSKFTNTFQSLRPVTHLASSPDVKANENQDYIFWMKFFHFSGNINGHPTKFILASNVIGQFWLPTLETTLINQSDSLTIKNSFDLDIMMDISHNSIFVGSPFRFFANESHLCQFENLSITLIDNETGESFQEKSSLFNLAISLDFQSTECQLHIKDTFTWNWNFLYIINSLFQLFFFFFTTFCHMWIMQFPILLERSIKRLSMLSIMLLNVFRISLLVVSFNDALQVSMTFRLIIFVVLFIDMVYLKRLMFCLQEYKHFRLMAIYYILATMYSGLLADFWRSNTFWFFLPLVLFPLPQIVLCIKIKKNYPLPIHPTITMVYYLIHSILWIPSYAIPLSSPLSALFIICATLGIQSLILVRVGVIYIKLKELYIQWKGIKITNEECAICQESFNLTEENKKTLLRDIYLTSCGHSFHKKCIQPWLETRRQCPLCRATLEF